MDRESPISGIWENDYVITLGTLDHCQEVLTLYNKLRELKALYDEDQIAATTRAFENETMDLYIILEKWALGNKDIYNRRVKRFAEKASEPTKETTETPDPQSKNGDGW